MFEVAFQSNRMQLNTSVLHGATAYLTSTTQLLGKLDTSWLDWMSDFLASDVSVTTVKDLRMTAGTNGFTCFSKTRGCHTTNFHTPGYYWEMTNGKTQ